LPDELIAEVDRWAEERELTRSEAIRALIEQGLNK
jgi:metal-responsive CopG/Arc/MetJ family transcriptional regulator